MSTPTPNFADLRAAYEKFAQEAGAFDRETTLQLRQREAQQKEWLAARKAQKADLMAKKLGASQAMNNAEEAAAIDAKAEADAKAAADVAAAKAAQEAPPAPKKVPVKGHASATVKVNPPERQFEDKDAKR